MGTSTFYLSGGNYHVVVSYAKAGCKYIGAVYGVDGGAFSLPAGEGVTVLRKDVTNVAPGTYYIYMSTGADYMQCVWTVQLTKF